MARINELRDGVFAVSTDNWRLNSGVVLGTRRALVVDTGAGPRQGREILDAVRSLTGLPLTVVNTHAHHDHYMGNAVFQREGASEFWAHRGCAEAILRHGDYHRSFVGTHEPEMAAADGPDTGLVVPNRHLPGTGRRPALARIELGERSAVLFALGRGHTDNDVCVGADDVVFTGDLVEQGADPSFEDSFPRGWATALEHLAGLDRYSVFVPGHGHPVERGFVRQQAQLMRTAIERVDASANTAAASGGVRPVTASMFRLPYGPGAARVLLDRLERIRSEDAVTAELAALPVPQPSAD
ncbi:MULTISPECIES: MBL fold metallo-hydrolase [Kocuria]|uniref:MBL fold metallo-hydrolase n=1 Tax=Kocuria TaxID=57493 RepID=UPI002040DA6A|nr:MULTISPECIES: MBL fold metallo-hydrolase [Kocuria]MCM3687661.1 MBL fold metallo-hydrolase [Kocuria rosea]HST71100.1 MBL fold metallo-hydrolase [Kocuria rosea]